MELLASFEAVAGTLSFTRAASQRALTQSAVSRHVRALEVSLQVTLFDRGHRGLTLTPEGQVLLATCRDAMQRLRDTLDDLHTRPRRRSVSLTTTPGFAHLWLARRLPDFTAAHPDVDVRVDSAFGRRNLADDGFDLAVRYVGPGEHTGKLLFDEQVREVCSPAWVADPARRDGPPVRIDVAHRSETGTHDDWQRWDARQATSRPAAAQTLTFSTYPEAVAAAAAGAGLLLGRYPLIAHELRTRALVPTPAGWVATGRRYVMVVDPAAQARADVRALADWLLACAGHDAAAAPDPHAADDPAPAAARTSRKLSPSGTPAGRR